MNKQTIFLTLDEVAKRLSVGDTTVKRLISTGLLESQLLAGTRSRRVSEAQLEAYMAKSDEVSA